MPREASTRTGFTSIVIPVLNQKELLHRTLDSIARHTPRSHEVVVVDNGSGEETREFLSTRPVRLVINPRNRGFAAAINQGVAAARGEVIVLANSDIEVTPGWLEELLAALAQPQAGLAGPLTNYCGGVQKIEVDYEKSGGPDGVAEQLRQWRGGCFREVDKLVGFLMAVTRETLDAVGPWDERFGIGNFEDDDYCLRVRLLGLRCMMAEGAYVHHEGSATFRGERIGYLELMQKNREIYMQKWRNPDLALLPSLLRRLDTQASQEIRHAS
jgi:GT2 family glycosyltransferase